MEQVPKETGGPVYPGKAMDVFEINERGQMQVAYSSGMTLRDYFAAKAMQGFSKGVVDYGWDDEILDAHAKDAYRIADAMLKARK